MDGQQVRLWESRCIEESPPACTASCPIHVDARGLAELVAKGDLKAAHALMCRHIPFPGIIGTLCEHPCERNCRRAEAGGAIRIQAIERTVMAQGFESPPFRRGRATERKRVAIVGGGLSGLAAAADLIIKGHSVVVHEAGPVLLPRLRGEPIPTSIIESDLARFDNTGIEILCNQRVDIQNLMAEFDAIYLGIGSPNASHLGTILATDQKDHLLIDPVTMSTSLPNVFAGGTHRYGEPYSLITSLYDGRCAATSIERMLQGASLTANRDHQGSQATRLYVNVARHPPLPVTLAKDQTLGYSQAEAQAEASRCFPCHCLECVRVCPYLEHYGAYPKRYIREIYNNATIVMGAKKSNRMIDSCTLCGLCASVCPEALGMGEVCLSARQDMVERKRMPVSHHDFALRDLAFSSSDAFSLARHQPGYRASKWAFYPGCQLAGSSPEQVAQTYAHLCKSIDGGVGLILGCCGAPAHWAARTDLFESSHAAFRTAWETLGRPQIISACSSCYRMFTDHQPDVPIESLWPLLERVGLPDRAHIPHTLAIHDPCTTRHNKTLHASVRRLAHQCSANIIELDGAERTTCCGFGGLASFANSAVSNKIIDQRISQNGADYLTYCAMCRDNFARRGKSALHILDLLYPDLQSSARQDPGFSARQENRGRLKRRLLRELWGEDMDEPKHIKLVMTADVQADLERKMILLEDIRQVINHAEKTGEKLVDKTSGRIVACHRPLRITYWVEYAIEADQYRVHRAYSHRMELGATS